MIEDERKSAAIENVKRILREGFCSIGMSIGDFWYVNGVFVVDCHGINPRDSFTAVRRIELKLSRGCPFAEVVFDEKDNCIRIDFEKAWHKKKALIRAEEIGVYEYSVNGKFMEYWVFCGNEGFYFVRYDLDEGVETFRGANIPWDGSTVPAFLKDQSGATLYNYLNG